MSGCVELSLFLRIVDNLLNLFQTTSTEVVRVTAFRLWHQLVESKMQIGLLSICKETLILQRSASVWTRRHSRTSLQKASHNASWSTSSMANEWKLNPMKGCIGLLGSPPGNCRTTSTGSFQVDRAPSTTSRCKSTRCKSGFRRDVMQRSSSNKVPVC